MSETDPPTPGITEPHLFGMTPEDLTAHVRARGGDLAPDEARRVLAHLITRGRPDPRPKQPIRRVAARAIGTLAVWTPLEVVERAADPGDGFVKYLLRSTDGELFEAVRIPLHKPNCYTICLSSQVGCAMRCGFCRTGRMGFRRNLSAWEMVASFVTVREDTPGRVTGAVFQGQGEPFHNYDDVLQAARVLSHPCGGQIHAGAITITTVGIIPAIYRYAAERVRFRLMFSLCSAIPERRARLCPAAARASLDELAEAIRTVAATSSHRVSIAWLLLGGVNTGPEEIVALGELLGDLRLRVSVLDFNGGPEEGFRRATPDELHAFLDGLQGLGVSFVRRYSGGIAAQAACGMLRNIRLGAGSEKTAGSGAGSE